jgi:hypothetical protein
MLEPDQGEIMADAMIFLANNLANGSHTPYSRPQFQPSSSSITINCLFFASLSASLVAALASVVALQWVADYDAAISRGGSSPEDRAKRRQFRYAGVVQWRMGDIIAALPLLLYCSFAVFLAGLIIWMWSLHYIVGFVVAGGTGLAVLFYGLSTFLSIVFVSAPFRTPLGRWIYVAVHFWFSVMYLLARALRVPSIAVWFERGHLAYTVSRKREDREVDKRNELAMDALVWLANHLSISQDSYDRLLLLVGELPKLSWGEPSSVSWGEAPWFLIFDLLGWRNLKTDEDHSISKQEIHSFGILAQLYRMPQVQVIISPTHPLFYHSDEMEEEYWLQSCGKTTSQWSPKLHPNIPNSLFLLLRDIPLPSNNTAGEIELTIWLSRWRNSAHKSPKYGESNRGNASTSDGSAAVIADQFLTEEKLDSWFSRSNEYLFTITIQRMIQTFVISGGEIPPPFLNRLRLYFESIIAGSTPNLDTVICLLTPLSYRDVLLTLPWTAVIPHYAFTLLLARNLKYYVGDEKVRRVKEVILMLWAAPISRSIIGIVPRSQVRIVNARGMEKFFDANKAEVMTWIKNANQISHIQEILEHLAAAQADQPDIGPLWRVKAPFSDADPHLFEALITFHLLITRDISLTSHRTLIHLLCRDIELGPLETFTSYLTISRLEYAEGIPDPCLRFLAQYVRGMGTRSPDHPLVEIKDPWKDSWARVATHLIEYHEGTHSQFILPLQASLWPALPDTGNTICERALREPNVLVSSHFITPIFSLSLLYSPIYSVYSSTLSNVLTIMTLKNIYYSIFWPT